MSQETFVFPTPSQQEISEAMISNCKDELAAIRLMIDLSGLEHKQIALEFEMSEFHLSEILSGKKNIPHNLPRRLMDLCGNEIYLRWLAISRGYGLVRLRSQIEIDFENVKRELQEVKKEAQKEREMMLKLIKELK